ncbi:UNVERIFIED_CONTAM: hypothetical protein Sradi_0188700 [Sesamum radiatum]|uniref:Uncharacterized protein n=1 Tax=Sesamum radiatum TaxID=300843 RepID=A0AAW2W0E4_SESRA
MVESLEEKVSSMKNEITMLSSELEDCRQVVQELASAFGGGGIADMRREMEQMSIQIGLLQLAVSNGPAVAHDTGARLRIPEPKAYNGARDAKEVDNFLFYIEQYFLAVNVEDEARKASPAKPVEPQASANGGNDSEKDDDNLGAISQWCNTLSHQVAAKKTVPPRAGKTAAALTGSHPEEEVQPQNPRKILN